MEQNIVGIKTATIALAFLGSALSLSYAKELTRFQAVIAVTTGCVSAVCAAQLIRHYGGVPESLEAAVAFFGGLFAMRLLPVLMDALSDSIKKFKFPWSKE